MWGEYPSYLPERIEFLGAQLDKLFATVEEVLGIKVTQEAWDKALSTSRQLFRALGRLTRLMGADPMPISGVELGVALQMVAASTDRAMTDEPEAVNILCEETQEPATHETPAIR